LKNTAKKEFERAAKGLSRWHDANYPNFDIEADVTKMNYAGLSREAQAFGSWEQFHAETVYEVDKLRGPRKRIADLKYEIQRVSLELNRLRRAGAGVENSKVISLMQQVNGLKDMLHREEETRDAAIHQRRERYAVVAVLFIIFLIMWFVSASVA
jgi:hypothetical protein